MSKPTIYRRGVIPKTVSTDSSSEEEEEEKQNRQENREDEVLEVENYEERHIPAATLTEAEAQSDPRLRRLMQQKLDRAAEAPTSSIRSRIREKTAQRVRVVEVEVMAKNKEGWLMSTFNRQPGLLTTHNYL